MLQTFSFVMISMRITRTMMMASCPMYVAVKVADWVRNPGPTAEVAISRAAPSKTDRLDFFSSLNVSFCISVFIFFLYFVL